MFGKQEPEPPKPTMRTEAEIRKYHDMLVMIVMGQTPIRFEKLRKGEPNPLQMMAEVLAWTLGNQEHGRQVDAVLKDLEAKLRSVIPPTIQENGE